MVVTQDIHAYQWALPESLDLPPDRLQLRLDFYNNTVVMYGFDDGTITNPGSGRTRGGQGDAK